MDVLKQVDSQHYRFSSYVTRRRWASFWHQIDEVIRLAPDTVLEIGAGTGLFKALANVFELHVETLDIDPDLHPDHLGSVCELPFPDCAFDVVCAFQVLEHLPYQDSLRAFAEMCRVARRAVVISLPDATNQVPFLFGVPGGREYSRPIPKRFWKRTHHFDGQHYWELNAKGYSYRKVVEDFSHFGFHLERSYLVDRNPYHRFMIYRDGQP